ncbi:hypothetical protein [Arcobacter sp. LA11]|uniref:hypothetical protein n=1 Tax=Arcobacter sp. LA11 TaxID=1898176 RepID=UPI0009345E24|nr:hypothetical protein [Arcobacter sp. LA11]
MSNEVEIRKMPKKTIVLISIMTLIALAGFIFITTTKSMKMEEVLSSLGHKNIIDIKVINKLSVEDKETKIKSTVYKIAFKDIDLNKDCIGFVHRSNKGKYSKDIDCK